jgi:hypothetical protein
MPWSLVQDALELVQGTLLRVDNSDDRVEAYRTFFAWSCAVYAARMWQIELRRKTRVIRTR